MFQFCTKFKGVPFSFWIDEDEAHSKNFWATARQIGKLLGFRNGARTIEKIRHSNFAVFKPMEVTFMNGEKKILYSFMDMLKFCKHSDLPERVVDGIVDFLWKIAEDVYDMKTGRAINKGSDDEDDAKDLYVEDKDDKDTERPQESADKAAPDCDVINFMKEIRHELAHALVQIGAIKKQVEQLQAEKENEARSEARFWQGLGELCGFLSNAR